jgi:hypothetical protein
LKKISYYAVAKWFSGLHEIDRKLGGQNKIPLSDNRKIVVFIEIKKNYLWRLENNKK